MACATSDLLDDLDGGDTVAFHNAQYDETWYVAQVADGRLFRYHESLDETVQVTEQWVKLAVTPEATDVSVASRDGLPDHFHGYLLGVEERSR